MYNFCAKRVVHTTSGPGVCLRAVASARTGNQPASHRLGWQGGLGLAQRSRPLRRFRFGTYTRHGPSGVCRRRCWLHSTGLRAELVGRHREPASLWLETRGQRSGCRPLTTEDVHNVRGRGSGHCRRRRVRHLVGSGIRAWETACGREWCRGGRSHFQGGRHAGPYVEACARRT